LYGAIIAGALSLSDVFALSLSPSEPPTEYLFVRESGKHDEKLVQLKNERKQIVDFFRKNLLCAMIIEMVLVTPTIH
jgi:hypothetical protein